MKLSLENLVKYDRDIFYTHPDREADIWYLIKKSDILIDDPNHICECFMIDDKQINKQPHKFTLEELGLI